jgi:ABC-type multidrug transport system fused ATPase/permease subunit
MKTSASNSPVAEILVAYWRSDWRALLSVAAIVLLSSASSIAAPYLFSRLIDRLPKEAFALDLAWAFVAYAALVGFASALLRIVQFLSVITAENLGFIASTQFFNRILKKRAEFFVAHNPAEIQNAATQGRGALVTFVQIGLIVLVPSALQIALTLLTLGALLNLQVVATVVAYGCVAIGLAVIVSRRSKGSLSAAMTAAQDNARFVGNAMNAMETLRHLGSHHWMSQRFTEKARNVRDHWHAYMLRGIAMSVMLGLSLAAQFAINFLLLLPNYQAGALTIGDLVLFNTLLLQLNHPFEMIANTLDNFARARAQLVPLTAMWQAPEEDESPHSTRFAPQDGRILFESVGFAYGNGRGISDVSFTARRGAITFIVGDTGAGKSTIFKLALKSIEPQQGRILVDDIDFASISRADWYRAVAVVPQDVVLLNESLADNILLGRPRDDTRLRDVAAKAAILSFIEALPAGFDTNVGERGLKLSGGERQRIAIARALYGNPSALFLDEASSALDDGTERDIMSHVRALSADVTVLAITHRRSVIAPTDTVVELGAEVRSIAP